MTDLSHPSDASTGNGRFAAHGVREKFTWALRSDPGQVREHNEDFGGVFVADSPDHEWERGPIFVVADGLGGHAAGEVASRVAVDAIIGDWSGARTVAAPLQALRSAIRSANVAVFDAALEHGRRGMGTTIVAATLAGKEAIIAHVGDSRGYLVHGERCAQLTTDHSRVAEMVRTKLLTPEQAATHPARSMLTRSLGAQPAVQVDVTRHPIDIGDVLVLCTDGVWDVVSRAEITETALAVGTPVVPSAVEAADSMIDLARKRGAPDNVTVAVVHITSDQPMPAAAGRRSLFRRAR